MEEVGGLVERVLNLQEKSPVRRHCYPVPPDNFSRYPPVYSAVVINHLPMYTTRYGYYER